MSDKIETEFNAKDNTPLKGQSIYIKASAGTGKTYNIQKIVRQLLERKDVPQLEKILIVTFTEKAAGDVDEDTMGLSPVAVRKWLEENAEVKNGACYNKSTGRKISAVVPMHTFGHPVHLDEFVKLCKEWKLALVEDAAESIGSFYKGKHTGLFGKVAALSFI